ncbi:hypothetical protein SCP_0411340 [Sparassis crispa]|uniref:Uncharacterized protein n=1 Tax=Sparassis crispa TaxID=139825 RepID=A0A401GKS5_9APHY|nr:hypothetical protein SCP_0411340 [Sparassis crispa]GBE82749.1 hypothetical protein SCP_0411340 [Sparassis crispa]
MSAIPNAQLASEYDEDACIRGRISIIRGRWESAYSTPLTKLLKQLSDKGYNSQKNETCTQDIQFFEPTDPGPLNIP